ncbi:Hypothetical predicted protein [Olea europaea subsp. europaea]|uniref:Uncharacterized protein n=2 Tax=Olea europaea subsp. europaea TaxID=158383 RepID=A0A8S0UG08_OLEEU|nr:Hypothetical predicted protein [Olea europaea subsp. europaea]
MDSDVEASTLELRKAVAFPSNELRTPPSTPQIDALKLVASLKFCSSHDTKARRSTYAHRDEARHVALSFPHASREKTYGGLR